jgi:signal transduction histidine kinase
MRRASPEYGDDVERLIGHELDQSGDAVWSDGTSPEIRLASGTREVDRLSVDVDVDVVDTEATTLDTSSQPLLEIVQIVHDFKNPLATIALEMCILEDRLLQAELRGAVTRVAQNVAYLDRMVQDLLDAGSMQVDRFTLHRHRIELRALIEQVIERSTATRDRPRVCLDAPAPVFLAVDELRIERVISNLLANALKYSPSSTDVLIRLEVRQPVVRVSVIDAGPGIPADETRQLFGRYQRAATANGTEGNGLGLYVSKRIIEAHGGHIGVDSRHGAGSCFFFELPLTS